MKLILQISFCDRKNPTLQPSIVALNQLPTAYIKKYKYASRFVSLVKSKTPRIIFYSPQAKCTTFEDPKTDIQFVFYNGTKVKYSAFQSSVQIYRPGESDQIQVFDFRLPFQPAFQPIIQHCHDCYQRCLEIEKYCDPNGSFPIIIKSSHLTTSDLVDDKSTISVSGSLYLLTSF